jgi:DNA-binding transcriptional regulator GbsR (MarR family)
MDSHRIMAGFLKSIQPLSRARVDMIDSAGRLSQFIGLPRSTGQIYGLLYLSPTPLSLDDIVELLGISKASASTGTRQLTSLRAIRQIWVPGARRDHFQAEPDVAALVRIGYTEFLKPRLSSSHKRLEQMTASLEEDLARGSITEEDYRLCAARLQSFFQIQNKLQMLVPLAEKLL